MQPSPRSCALLLTCILILGFGLRTWQLAAQGHWHSDGLLFYEVARGFFHDGKVLSGFGTRTLISRGNLEFYDNLFLQGKFGHILLILAAFGAGGIRLESVLSMSAGFGMATIYVICLLGREVFGRETGLIAAALAACSLILTGYSRSALTPASGMFFFTLGLFLFFRHCNRRLAAPAGSHGFVHPLFWSGLAIGYAFTIHYNLAYYFLLVYFSHLIFSLAAYVDKRGAVRENLLFAAGLALPLAVFEFGYPVLYYAIYKRHILYTYFQEVLFNALEAGGGSRLWNYFPMFVANAENYVYCALVAAGGLLALAPFGGGGGSIRILLFLFAFLPPVFLSVLNFPLVGRNLSPSLPLFTLFAAHALSLVVRRLNPEYRVFAGVAAALAVMSLGFPQLANLYAIKSPYVAARHDVGGRGVLLLGEEDLYRDAILYRVSGNISVAPAFDSLARDPKSRDYYLLARLPSKHPLTCAPVKTYKAARTERFPLIRNEDHEPRGEIPAEDRDLFAIYDLAQCLPPQTAALPPGAKSITEIGKSYAARQPGMTSLARVQFYTGVEYMKQGYLDEAIHEYRQAVRNNPNLLHAHNNLALSLINRQRFDDALPVLEKAEALAPGLPATQNLFGLAHFSRGDFDRAEQYFLRSLQADPRQPAPYQYLIKIYALIRKDMEKAQQFAQQLQALSPPPAPGPGA